CERPIVEYFDTQGQKHFLSSLKYTQGTNKVGDIRTVVYDKHNPQISEYKDQFWAIIFMAILISITIVMMTAWAHVYIIAWIINKLMGSKIR
ncbi:MAG TPA: hypothetical protein VK338_03940, partial [Candidatus Nitrosocosmicus sp.]|nr:hypothetical protein [Candidatus Nitrosocosmicus sp.]